MIFALFGAKIGTPKGFDIMKKDNNIANEMDEIIERLHEVIEKSGMSYATLSEKTGIAKSSLQRYATGQLKRIPIDNIKKIADACHASARYIMGWEENKEDSVVVLDEYKYYEIPRFDSIAAGIGVIADAQPIGTDLLPFKSPYDASETMTIKVTGDSMYPKIEDGDVIAVKKQTSVDSGTVAAVLIDGQDAVVKKVTYGDDWIILHSFNPEYMDREFRGADVQRIRIMGKVTKIIKEM